MELAAVAIFVGKVPDANTGQYVSFADPNDQGRTSNIATFFPYLLSLVLP